MLGEAYGIDWSVRSDLGASRRDSERAWICVNGSSRASTIWSIGSALDSGKVTWNSGSWVCKCLAEVFACYYTTIILYFRLWVVSVRPIGFSSVTEWVSLCYICANDKDDAGDQGDDHRHTIRIRDKLIHTMWSGPWCNTPKFWHFQKPNIVYKNGPQNGHL